MLSAITTETVDTISHLVKLSVAPVFLLSAIAGMLGVFTGRLTRIIDRVEKLDKIKENHEKNDPNYQLSAKLSARRAILIKRLSNINLAIFFSTAAGVLVALVIITMFLSQLISFHGSLAISLLFILTMAAMLISLLLFVREIFYTTSVIEHAKDNKW